jgi:phospholipid/cholesterol/gamma-HCH transport system permease protein
MSAEGESTAAAKLALADLPDRGLRLVISGDWQLGRPVPGTADFLAALARDEPPARLAFDCSGLGRWDASLLVGLRALEQEAGERGVALDREGLPDGARRLLDLAGAVAERAGVRRSRARPGFLERIGEATLAAVEATRELARFLGELSFSALRLARGQAVFDRRDLMLFIEQTGASALPIVSLIAFLVGVIFAFVGVMQLDRFGAGIFVADLVTVAMVREMAAIMTGIIMAGRSGAAFAAELGTMKVNEEIDALHTIGISPLDYLVLPRTIALVLMLPLLAVYAALLGMLGGAVVSLVMLDVNLMQYMEQTKTAVDLNMVLGGLMKAVVFGIVIAISGCQQGLACGGSAMAVGQATTRAVVMAILLIVVTASVLTVIYTVFGI